MGVKTKQKWAYDGMEISKIHSRLFLIESAQRVQTGCVTSAEQSEENASGT